MSVKHWLDTTKKDLLYWYDRKLDSGTKGLIEDIYRVGREITNLGYNIFVPNSTQEAAELYAPVYSDIKAGSDILKSGITDILNKNYLNGTGKVLISPIVAGMMLATPDGIDASAKASIKKVTTPKYIAKYTDNLIQVFDKMGDQVGFVRLEPVGLDMGIRYIERTKSLPKGELFLQIGTEAARQASKKLYGKKLITARKVTLPETLIPAITTGFVTKPIPGKIRTIKDANVTLSNIEEAIRSNLLVKELETPGRYPDLLKEFNYDIKQIAPLESYGASIPIYSIPELYDHTGKFRNKAFNLRFPISNQYPVNFEGENIWGLIKKEQNLPTELIPGFWASYVIKPKKNFGVKFQFKSGGKLNYLNLFK